MILNRLINMFLNSFSLDILFLINTILRSLYLNTKYCTQIIEYGPKIKLLPCTSNERWLNLIEFMKESSEKIPFKVKYLQCFEHSGHVTCWSKYINIIVKINTKRKKSIVFLKLTLDGANAMYSLTNSRTKSGFKFL
ncbi:hypothetical protein BpHYR1_044649 [Brachionus plicatilis]|uniref:Uncharacterized protein n=1 Tax=Brachionus plicatilis TaxID=10195 RepID=A0A3M7T6J6_BRAPC|nr:hypothetical protein BpHYR1_044649 [Brachionus plicatilis]